MTGVVIAALIIGLPALAFALWPLVRRGDGARFLPLPPDAREQLTEQKRTALRALRELDFEHGAGHLSDDDYAELRARYEGETARILGELDRLGPEPEAAPKPTKPSPRRAAPTRRSAWQHPIAIGVAAVVLVVFGAALGAGIVRHSTPEPDAAGPMPGTRPLADLGAPAMGTGGTPPMGGDGPRPMAGGERRQVTPEMLKGMLLAARTSLKEGRYGEAIMAYQAILKREPDNVDAITHLGLIVAIGGHVDSALQSFDRALAINPHYPPALLYRGQIFYEAKGNAPEAIKSWEQFLKVVPSGEDHDRVAQLIADAKKGPRAPAK